MSWSYYTKEAFVVEFDNVISLASHIMDQKGIMNIDDFQRNVEENYHVLFPLGDVDPKRLMKDLPGYYMVYLTKNWLEKANQPQNHLPANKSSERPYLRLVR